MAISPSKTILTFVATFAMLFTEGSGLPSSVPTDIVTTGHDDICTNAPNCELVDNGKGGSKWNITLWPEANPPQSLEQRGGSYVLQVAIGSQTTSFGSVNPTTMFANMIWECETPPECLYDSPWWTDTYVPGPYPNSQAQDQIFVTALSSTFSTHYEVQLITEAAWRSA
jgi:hypothetical protein